MCLPFYAQSSALPDFPFINVSGTGELNIKPNRASMTFSIVVFNKVSTVASEQHSARVSETIKILKDFNIQNGDIESFNINKEIVRNRGDDYQELAILGYSIQQHFTIELNSLDKYSEIMDSLLKQQNLEGLNSEFSVKEQKELQTKLVKMASEEALNKAKLLSSSMGVELGRLYAITDGSQYPWDFGKLGLSNKDSGIVLNKPRSRTQGVSQMFIPKSIALFTTVHVIYKLK